MSKTLGQHFPEGIEVYMKKCGESELKQRKVIKNALWVGCVPIPSTVKSTKLKLIIHNRANNINWRWGWLR